MEESTKEEVKLKPADEMKQKQLRKETYLQ